MMQKAKSSILFPRLHLLFVGSSHVMSDMSSIATTRIYRLAHLLPMNRVAPHIGRSGRAADAGRKGERRQDTFFNQVRRNHLDPAGRGGLASHCPHPRPFIPLPIRRWGSLGAKCICKGRKGARGSARLVPCWRTNCSSHHIVVYRIAAKPLHYRSRWPPFPSGEIRDGASARMPILGE